MEYKRIILLANPFFVYFKALNTEYSVVGMFNKSRVANVPKHINTVGEGAQIDLERIIRLDPDLIICNSYQLEELQSLKVPKLACDEYLEANPIGRLELIEMIAQLTNSHLKAAEVIEKRSALYQKHESLNTSILKLDNFGNGWYQPGCETYISKVIEMAGAQPLCVEKSEKSEKIAHETALYELSKNNYFLFMDWGRRKRGWKKRFNNSLKLDSNPKKIIYCNTAQTNYFEESALNSHLLINDLNTVLKTQKKGRFFEIRTLEN
jgi:iron complex transport system substrate-binding protein